MNRRLEQIAVNWATCARNQDVARLTKSVADNNFDENFIRAAENMVSNADNEFDRANNEFWQAFKYPLEIFDLKKGERPEHREVVNIYDEVEETWIVGDLSSSEEYFLLHTAGMHRLDIDRYHRWTRLPKLEAE